jgi:hypothetical protein
MLSDYRFQPIADWLSSKEHFIPPEEHSIAWKGYFIPPKVNSIVPEGH